MTAPIRFALLGKSGSGKSEAGTIICNRFGLRHIKTGTICREIARLLFANEDKSSTQRLDDALTQIDPSIFLRASLRNVEAGEGFVVDALRFRSDLAIALHLGCRTIRIVAPDAVRAARLKSRGQVFDPLLDGLHRSEIELDDAEVDFEISNEADLASLTAALSRIAPEG